MLTYYTPVQYTCTAGIHSMISPDVDWMLTFVAHRQLLPLLFSSLNQIHSGPKHIYINNQIINWYYLLLSSNNKFNQLITKFTITVRWITSCMPL